MPDDIWSTPRIAPLDREMDNTSLRVSMMKHPSGPSPPPPPQLSDRATPHFCVNDDAPCFPPPAPSRATLHFIIRLLFLFYSPRKSPMPMGMHSSSVTVMALQPRRQIRRT